VLLTDAPPRPPRGVHGSAQWAHLPAARLHSCACLGRHGLENPLLHSMCRRAIRCRQAYRRGCQPPCARGWVMSMRPQVPGQPQPRQSFLARRASARIAGSCSCLCPVQGFCGSGVPTVFAAECANGHPGVPSARHRGAFDRQSLTWGDSQLIPVAGVFLSPPQHVDATAAVWRAALVGVSRCHLCGSQHWAAAGAYVQRVRGSSQT